MQPVAFEDIAKLINLTPITKIDLGHPLHHGAQWDIFAASHTIQRQRYEYRVLYIKAAATNADLREAFRQAEGAARDTDVVYAPSLADSRELKELFGRPASKGPWRAFDDTAAYFRAFLAADLDAYAKNLTEAYPEPKPYIAPVIETPSGRSLSGDHRLPPQRLSPRRGRRTAARRGDRRSRPG